MKTNPTTLFDLNKSAIATAEEALDKSAFEILALKSEAFTAAGHEPGDFETWESFFNGHVANFRNLKTRKSPAQLAADLAANTPPKPLQAGA
jgi:hypothetical protein